MQKKKCSSLQLKTAISIIIALLIGSLVYLSITGIGNFCIEKFYLSDEREQKRVNGYVDDLNDYINLNKLKSTDTNYLKNWCKNKKHVYLTVFDNGFSYYETDGEFGENYDENTAYSIDDYDVYPIYFEDGTKYASVVEFSEDKLYSMVKYVALPTAAVIILLIILTFNQRVIRRIIKLSNEVQTSDTKQIISVSGNDEISSLCNDINLMKKSIIAHYEKEQEAINANNELLTSISHDIRTPLTALIGYSEMIADGSDLDKEEMIKYATVCRDKAYQLKSMTDSLFRYFFVYGKSQVDMSIKKYNAKPLLEQMLGEHMVNLQEKGFKVESNLTDIDCSVYVDVTILQRVFDNVFSNVDRYADINKPVSVNIKVEDGKVLISIQNRIQQNNHNPESTKIGLKTCEKIMQSMGGSFGTVVDRKTYTANVAISVATDSDI